MKKKILYFIIIFVAFFILYCFAINSIKFLCVSSEILGSNSSFGGYLISRIYLEDNRNKVFNEVNKLVLDDKYGFVEDVFIRVLGVVGDDRAIPLLMNIYIKNQEKEKLRYKNISIITSIGLIGDDKVIPFLEKILNKKQSKNRYYAARSLFLLTGEEVNYLNKAGTYQNFYPSPRDKEARSVILQSKERRRGYDEMMSLDALFRASL
ncbi:HEAT repeat domain-containing protein [Desulfuromonas acetoxidans]|uniref:HEAT repeat domain-containing protein n=1 Tax=Desulfuromonas acetoxidans (strain DSM 684 / 11070) TaxID=281689 RepID=Q1K2A2_DESA6|nr:HEAT repeat domain-containing protein [Desulfuromonas acetoxidans]EAT16537.1 hypothetical protein Dace_2632 [Desulfuromonas acetoxidans DSM 684]MBF0647052.1 HEAT repeat domain-containing protein [Desulfuromonas acetoxidans]NVD24648.1 HEAT repeat domain-containing protein [Desulfuromonas acetoxidans]NVE16693.1 HEAT repeat domain-containing protein [Desulfuromonas acetoxidans]